MGIPSESLNVSERRAIEDQLREAEGRFRTLVEQAMDGIFIAGVDGRYQDVNPAGCAMLGYSRDELLSLSMSDILAPEEIARLGGEVERLLGGSSVRSEWRFRRKDGSCFFGEVSGRRLPDASVVQLIAEHATLELGPISQDLKIGDKIELIPGYSDHTTPLHPVLYGLRNDRVEAVWPIAARGCIH